MVNLDFNHFFYKFHMDTTSIFTQMNTFHKNR